METTTTTVEPAATSSAMKAAGARIAVESAVTAAKVGTGRGWVGETAVLGAEVMVLSAEAAVLSTEIAILVAEAALAWLSIASRALLGETVRFIGAPVVGARSIERLVVVMHAVVGGTVFVYGREVMLTIGKAAVSVRVKAVVPILRESMVAEVAATDCGSAISVEVATFYMPGVAEAAGTSVESVDGPVVNIAEAVAAAEVVVAAVIAEVAAAPVSAVEAGTEVAEAIVDAAIVAD